MSSNYAYGLMHKALETAASHQDDAVREHAAVQAENWAKALDGMSNGAINVGSRVPVKEFPAWVTLSVQWGGYATGGAVAEDSKDGDPNFECSDDDDSDEDMPTADSDEDNADNDKGSKHGDKGDANSDTISLDMVVVNPNIDEDNADSDTDSLDIVVNPNMDETQLAEQLGIPEGEERRAQLFAYFLSDEGLESLYALLDSGEYEVRIPEDAALLTVAWLIRAGDTAGALQILDEIKPFSHRFRFAPRPRAQTVPTGQTSLITVGEARRALHKLRPARRIEKQRQTLQVWNPFADRLLALWYPCVVDGVVTPGGEDWKAQASALVAEFAELKNMKRRCRKVVSKGSNIAWLVDAAAAAATGDEPLSPLLAGRVRTAVAQMVAKRGPPGSETLTALRERQSRVARIPAARQLARIAADRLADLRQYDGLTNPADYSGPITAKEAESSGVPINTPMPPVVHRVLKRTLIAPVDEIDVPSVEVYAKLVPVLVSSLIPATYVDKRLARLMARNYEAFSKRRSLLLLELDHQVRLTELPWVIATEKHQEPPTGDETRKALDAIKHLGGSALQRWPGTILPNKLVSQMNSFVWLNHLDLQTVPLLEELAADIFFVEFSDKYMWASKIASTTAGPLYLNYYGIDVEVMQQLRTGGNPNDKEAMTRETRKMSIIKAVRSFALLCNQRTGNPDWSVESYGKIIEQSQILTTHNLAVLVSLGLSLDWPDLALRAWRRCVHLLRKACLQRKPLCFVKNAAYAWRQAVFYISIADTAAVSTFIEHLDKDRAALPELARVVDGFKDIVSGGSFNNEGESANGTRFTGWVSGSHWILKGAYKPLRS